MTTIRAGLRPRRLFVLFFVFFIVYNINLVPRPNSDAISSELLPFAVATHHTLFLDAF